MTVTTKRDPSVVIIGAGMAGILMAIKLREAGINNITIFEKADAVGGTWRENTYPGVSCDVPAHLYAYSFSPFTKWDKRFAEGSQLREYFQKVADEYGITEIVKFNELVTDAKYYDGRWDVSTSKGNAVVADFVVCATGILHHPAYPNIEGLDSFEGKMFHTARWDHGVDLTDKSVGVIGTGSSSAQVIPAIVRQAGRVTVFQRTAQWIYPRPDKDYSGSYKKLLNRFPFLATVIKGYWNFVYKQVFARAVIGKPVQLAMTKFIVNSYFKKSVKDPELRKKLTPNYSMGCKRLILSSDFYEGIQHPNCDLVIEGIDHIEREGVVTKDGTLRELDVLVLATGFKHFNFMRPMNLLGKDGISIDEVWNDRYINYRSITIPNFPNFFLITGPNSPIGNFSLTSIAEIQTQYILQLIDQWRTREFNAIEPKISAANQFLERIQQGLQGTVWTAGCQSWYLDQSGSPVLWPWTFEQFISEMREPDMRDFVLH